jgi:hypothetical protein
MPPSASNGPGGRRHPFLHDLFPGLTSFTSLLAAAKAAQRGKRFRPDVLAFNSRLEAELFQLQEELRSHSYQPGSYRRFEIRDPKPRTIAAAPYRDRVVHHALCAAIAPPLERRFLRTTFANRLGYGSHRALRRFLQASRAHPWVLTADIRLYFPSIDHQILMDQLARVIACPSTLWLVDDFALFATSREALEEARGVIHQELIELRLRLHPIKSQIRRCGDGASFVGFFVKPARVRVRNHNLIRGQRRLKRQARAVANGHCSPEAARRSLLSWSAHLAHGHTLRLRRRLFAGLSFAPQLP